MICDGNTCDREYPDIEVNDQSLENVEDEFVESLKHEKCKIIRLVRQQMDRFHDTQYSLPSVLEESRRKFKLGLQNTTYDIINQELNVKEEDTNNEANITPRTFQMTSSTLIRQARLARSLGNIRRKMFALMSVAGLVALMLLVYSVYFRLHLCNNGQSIRKPSKT